MNLSTPFAQNVLTDAQNLKAEIARMTANYNNLTATLANLVGNESGTHTVENVGDFVVSENNVYDAAIMLAALKPGQIQRVTERKLVPARVKSIYPAVYAAAKDSRGVKVALR
jgi:hypothetical protein